MPPTCFVIMGFGKKTDYGEKARTLDLDATYKAIIKPAVEDCGLTCIRADEVTHSGVIDVKMYLREWSGCMTTTSCFSVPISWSPISPRQTRMRFTSLVCGTPFGRSEPSS